jgi:hypothetical protein
MKMIPSNPGPHPRSTRLVESICRLLRVSILTTLTLTLAAQTPPPTGPQTLALSVLRAGPNPLNPQSQINAIASSPQGNLYLLVDLKDGIRLLETDPTANTILAQTQLGAAGDIGLALTLDPTGNLYITGTSTSGTLSATSGAAFPAPTGTSTNSFVAKFDLTLHPLFVTFTGASPMVAQSIAVTADAVFLTGLIFTPNLPVTPNALLQSPAANTPQNGFVEKFSSDGTHLLYATYLTAANGTTSPTAIAADAADNAYIVGSTSSAAYPTTPNALIPQALGSTSGFLTKLSTLGDALVFSTYIPGSGLTSLTLDPTANNLLLSGNIALGQFPIANVAAPLTPLAYQSLLRIPLDGSTVLSSTLLASGSQSFATPGPSASAWVAGSLTLPLLPLTPLSSIGTSFALHVTSTGLIDQTTRLGGIATSNPGFASAPILLTSLATDTTGNPIFVGSFQPTASQSLLATQTFDLPVTSPTPAFPDPVHSAVLPPPPAREASAPAPPLTSPTSPFPPPPRLP